MTVSTKKWMWRGLAAFTGAAALLLGSSAQAQEVSNRYVRLSVDPGNSRFTIARMEGDPRTVVDNFLRLLFQDPAVAVKTTVFMGTSVAPGSETFLYFDEGDIVLPPSIGPDGRSIISQASFPPAAPDAEGRFFLVTQKVSLVRDIVRIEYTVENRGVSRQIGIRVATDPAMTGGASGELTPGFDDHEPQSIPIFVPGQGYFSFETNFAPPRMPASWFATNSFLDPSIFTQGIFQGLGATIPNRVVFAGEAALVEDGGGDPPLPDWDIIVNPFQNILGPDTLGGDASVASFYGPLPLGSNQRRSYVTYIGEGVADHSYAGPAADPIYVGAVQTPSNQPLVGGLAQDFDADGYAMNLRNTSTVPGVSATILPPLGLVLAPGQLPTVLLGDLDPDVPGVPNTERTTTWTLQATGDATGLLPVNVTFNSLLGATTTTRLVNVPQGKLFRLRTVLEQRTFPFTFADAAPEVVLGLPTAFFDIFFYNPTTGLYERPTAIVPGQSYWVRAVGVPGDITVVLNGATAINIPQGGSFTTPVLPGWNMVGSASPYGILLEDVQFSDPLTGNVFSFDDAVRNRIILGSVWTWSPTLNRYVKVGPTDIVPPGQGLWVFVVRTFNVVFPAPLGLGIKVS